MREILERLESERPESLLPSLAWLAGSQVDLDQDDVKGALRRAELLLAAGGDPRRELDFDGRAVAAVAADLDGDGVRDRFEDALTRLADASQGLSAVSGGLARLRARPDLAWRTYAGTLLAEAIAGDESR